MSRHGNLQQRLITDLHADACSQSRLSTRCWPTVVPDPSSEPQYYDVSDRAARIEVVYCEWCPECGAADWEVV